MRRAKPEPGLVIEPRVSLSPDWCREGTRPSQAASLSRSLEASEVADLEVEHERRQRLDAAEAAQPGDRRGVLGLAREQGESFVESCATGEQAVDRGERVDVGELGRDVLEPLPGKPALMRLRPAAAAVVDASVAEQQLRDPVAQPGEVAAHLLARASEIAGRLEARRRGR